MTRNDAKRYIQNEEVNMNTNTMATLKEKAAEYYMDGYNCAECILHAANEQWQHKIYT